MPRAAKLKVFRTPIGFHDAYVAAPSQKAAMEAWGSGTDLFARGEAELVTDPALTAEPVAPAKARSGPARKPAPRPSRAELDQAEQAAAAAAERHRAERDALAGREAALARERRELDKAQAADARRLEQARERAESAYEAALRRWRG